MQKNTENKSFMQVTLFAGVIIGLSLFSVELLGTLFKWGLTDSSWGGWLVFAVYVWGCLYFGRKRAKLAGPAGFSYGQAFQFLLMSFVYAAVVLGIGVVLLNFVLAPGYHEQVAEHTLYIIEDMLERNPMATTAAVKLQMNFWRIVYCTPMGVFGSTLFITMLGGVFISLFASIFIKRPADPFYEEEGTQEGEE